MDIDVSYTLLHLEEGFFYVNNTKGELMGGNGIGSGVSRRVFLGAGGAMLLGAACGGSPAAVPQGSADAGVVYPTFNPLRVGTVQLPPQEGKLEFLQTGLIDIPQTPTPAGIFVGNDEATVVSSRDLGGLPAMNGLFRFGLPGANSSWAFDLGSQSQLYLSDAAILPDNSFVITAENGFYHGNVFYPFPSELNELDCTLRPGAAAFTDFGNAGALWITVSVFHDRNYTSGLDPFLASVLLAYPVVSSQVDTEAVEIVPTSGQNATAIGLRGTGEDQQLLVLNSGNHSLSSEPIMDVFAVQDARYLGSIELRSGMTMQTSTRLAISNDGEYAFIGAGDDSGKVLKVGIQEDSVAQQVVHTANFHSSVVLNGGFVFVTSFDWEQSSLTVLDTEQLSPVATIDLQDWKAGSSAAYANGIIQMLPHRAVFIEPVEVQG